MGTERIRRNPAKGTTGRARPQVVGAFDDSLESEADRIVERIMTAPAGDNAPRARLPSSGSSRIVRSSSVGPAGIGAEGGGVDPDTEQTLAAARSDGRALKGGVRSSMEAAFDADFSRVRIHDDSRATELSDRIQAEAFTIGSDIFFRGGMPNTSTRAGQELLAHELAHTTQQGSGSSIHRKYLVGAGDWLADSEHTGVLGDVKARSAEMVAIDNAVTAWRTTFGLHNVSNMQTATQQLLTDITTWRGTKLVSPLAMRATEVRDLKTEAAAWQTRLNQWMTTQYDDRVARHRQNCQTVRDWIDEGRQSTGDARLRNACEWVQDEMTPFYVVTETADNKYRAAALEDVDPATLSDDALTYFPNPRSANGHLYDDDEGLYNKTQLDDPATAYQDLAGRGTMGLNRPGYYIVVTEAGVAQGKAALFQTLRHEVQHDADKHQAPELNARVAASERAKAKAETKRTRLEQKAAAAATKVATKDNKKNRNAATAAQTAFQTFAASLDYTERDDRVDSELALRSYKTEYRAHFYQGDPAFDVEPNDPTQLITQEGYQWTRRQWTIFSWIRKRYVDVARAWGGAQPTALQQMFRAAVVAYWNPDTEGFNKYNSPRIDNMYIWLGDVPAGTTDPNHKSVRMLLNFVRQLQRDDIAYLQDKTQAVMLRAKVNKHLKGDARKVFWRTIDFGDLKLVAGDLGALQSALDNLR